MNGVKDHDAAQRHRSCLVGAMNGVEHDLCCPTPFMLGTMICVGHEPRRLTPFTVLDRRHRPRHRGSALICCRKTPFNDALMLDLCRRHRSNPDVVGLIGVTRAEKTEFRCESRDVLIVFRRSARLSVLFVSAAVKNWARFSRCLRRIKAISIDFCDFLPTAKSRWRRLSQIGLE